MKKEDILKKAREEDTDEMENFVMDKSQSWVFLVMGICLIVFTMIKQERGEQTSDLTFTIALGMSVGNIYRFVKLRRTNYLIWAIITAICAVICLIFFIMHH